MEVLASFLYSSDMRLSSEQINSIESKALEALSSANGGLPVESIYPPINVVKVAEEFGLTVKSGQFSDSNISGAYKREDRTIYVAKDDVLQRQLFTIAHELGHFILHQDKADEVFYRHNLLNLDKEKLKEETEANWFAASILMPRTLFVKVWQAYHDLDKVADLFKVSRTAVYFRLKNLGLTE